MFYLRINDFDLSGITNEVNKWQDHGKYASYDISTRNSGKAKMWLENVFANDGSVVEFIIHKFGKKGMFRTKSFWVIELFSGPSSKGPMERHGCIPAKTLAGALTEAMRDIEFRFMSKVDFDLAVGAMTE